MDALTLVEAILGIIGGWAFAASIFLKPITEYLLIRFISCLCYEKLSQGEEIYWEDLESIYASECARLIGRRVAELTLQEGHILVKRLRQLCENSPPVNSLWIVRLDDLTRSLPQYWIDSVVGGDFYPKLLSLVLLAGQIGVLARLTTASLPLIVDLFCLGLLSQGPIINLFIIGVPTLIFSVQGFPIVPVHIRAWREVRRLEGAISVKRRDVVRHSSSSDSIQ